MIFIDIPQSENVVSDSMKTVFTVIDNLRSYNKWRRGDEDVDMPNPTNIGIWIDEICDEAERMEAELQETKKALNELQS